MPVAQTPEQMLDLLKPDSRWEYCWFPFASITEEAAKADGWNEVPAGSASAFFKQLADARGCVRFGGKGLYRRLKSPVVKPLTNPDIHIETEIPEGITPEGKKSLVAQTFQKGLSMASAAPDIRLRMILGEAYQKYSELFRWVADELVKDDAKAPGLVDLAKRCSYDSSVLANFYRSVGHRDFREVLQHVIQDAAEHLTEASNKRASQATKQIEHQTCSDPEAT